MRLPYKTLTIPYKKTSDGFKFLILRRADLDFWQWVSGGGESEDKDLISTVIRELKEEIGTSVASEDVMRLESRCALFEDEPMKYNDENITVLPEYTFAVNIKESEVKISEEHSEYRWVTKETAKNLLKYDSNKTALLELDKILRKEVDGSWRIDWKV